MLAQTNYIRSAIKKGDVAVSANVDSVEPGQHFHIDDNGEWDYADGTRNSFPTTLTRTTGRRFGEIQNELLYGRDEVTMFGKLTVLLSNYEIGLDQFLSGDTFEVGQPVYVTTDGQVTATAPTEGAGFPVGHVTATPQMNDQGMLIIQR